MSSVIGYDRGEVFLDNVSTFFTSVFADSDIAKAISDGTEEVLAQAYFNLLEVILSFSLTDIPVFHREKWRLLVFKESEKNLNAEALLKYGDGAVYGAQPADGLLPGYTFPYGGYAPISAASFQLPGKMVDVESYLTNRIHDPSLVLIKGQDFFVQNKVMFFKEDPFANSLVPKREIRDATGTLLDREVAIWALNSDHDYEFLWKSYGHQIGVFMKSSEGYKDFLKSAWKLFWAGPKITSLVSILNALFGLPTIKEPLETIQLVASDPTGVRVVTDRNVYIVPTTASLRHDLEIGLELLAGEPLSTAVQILDNVNKPGWWNNYKFLPIPASILTDAHYEDMVVFNDARKSAVFVGSTIPLQVSGDMSESRRLELEAFPLPIGAGWAVGDTTFMYHSLDLLFRFFFRTHLLFLKISLAPLETSRLTQKMVELLNDALPAYVHFISMTEITQDDEYDLGTEAEDADWEFAIAHTYSDEYTDVSDGYDSRGPWIVGFDSIVVGPPPMVYIGTGGFQPGVRWYLRKRKC